MMMKSRKHFLRGSEFEIEWIGVLGVACVLLPRLLMLEQRSASDLPLIPRLRSIIVTMKLQCSLQLCLRPTPSQ